MDSIATLGTNTSRGCVVQWLNGRLLICAHGGSTPLALTIAGWWSNGRTAAPKPAYVGSNPARPANHMHQK